MKYNLKLEDLTKENMETLEVNEIKAIKGGTPHGPLFESSLPFTFTNFDMLGVNLDIVGSFGF